MKRNEWLLIGLGILVLLAISKEKTFTVSEPCVPIGEVVPFDTCVWSYSCGSSLSESMPGANCCSGKEGITCQPYLQVAGKTCSVICTGTPIETTTTTVITTTSTTTTTIPTTTTLITTTTSETTTTISDEKKLDVVLVNDVSGSMSAGTKLNDMKKASKKFVEIILYRKYNYISLVSYNEQVKSFIELTRDNATSNQEIDSYVAIGQTCISCGIQKGIEILNAGTNPKKVMLVMTDGKANRKIGDPIQNEAEAIQEAIDKAHEASLVHNVELYCVAYGTDADTVTMQDMCQYGTYYYATEFNLDEMYKIIGYELVPEARALEMEEIYRIFDELWWSVWNLIQEVLNWLTGG